jgi:hypothetical protein
LESSGESHNRCSGRESATEEGTNVFEENTEVGFPLIYQMGLIDTSIDKIFAESVGRRYFSPSFVAEMLGIHAKNVPCLALLDLAHEISTGLTCGGYGFLAISKAGIAVC